jgi:hypothetical protein
VPHPLTEPRQWRQRRAAYDDKWVKRLPPRDRDYFEPDVGGPSGFGIRVFRSGRKSYTLVKRDIYKRQRWIALGAVGDLDLETARAKAREVIARLNQGQEPIKPAPPPPLQPQSLAAVAAKWLRQVERDGYRTAAEIKRRLDKYVLVYPAWRGATCAARKGTRPRRSCALPGRLPKPVTAASAPTRWRRGGPGPGGSIWRTFSRTTT